MKLEIPSLACSARFAKSGPFLTGAMYSPDEALRSGLIDEIASEDDFTDKSKSVAQVFAEKDNRAFTSIKKLLRKPVAERMATGEKDSIREFVEIWYSENMRKNLKEIKIY